jgi:glycosyltransferase involved in cell wall biosynthesis
MNIETYVLAHQEEPMIGYFMRHYSQFSQVILMEGHSTDNTVSIAKHFGAKHMPVDSNNEINDDIWTKLKNNCWKGSKADWVIICDVDEFMLHPLGVLELLDYLQFTRYNIFLPRLFNMFTDNFPTTNGQIYDEVKYGREGGAKMNIFKPNEIKEINYTVGCHHARPEGDVRLDINSPLMTLHMSHLSVDYTVRRRKYMFNRLSEVNKKMGWGYHLAAPEEEVRDYMQKEMTALIKVI